MSRRRQQQPAGEDEPSSKQFKTITRERDSFSQQYSQIKSNSGDSRRGQLQGEATEEQWQDIQIKTQNVKTSFRQQGETEDPRRSKSRLVPRRSQVPAIGAGRSRPDKSRSVPAKKAGRRSDPAGRVGRRKVALQQAKASSRNTDDNTSSREKLQPAGQGYQDQCQGGNQCQEGRPAPASWLGEGKMKTTPASRAIPAVRASSSKASTKRTG